MSKRSRETFEENIMTDIHNKLNPKRQRKSSPIPVSTEFECPVCFEEFSSAIYQCFEGHLLCHHCYPKFKKCPTCRCSLHGNIRNRILEQIICAKNKNKNNNNNNNNSNNNNNILNKNNKKKEFKCCLCNNNSYLILSELNNHYNTCVMRKIKCSFSDCKWIGYFKSFCDHAQNIHHTCYGSVQPSPSSSSSPMNTHKLYTFNHAIKFPRDTLKRTNADFIWPKIVRFNDGKEFFILSRYHAEYVTVFVRLMKLSKLKVDEVNKLNNNHNQLLFNNGKGRVLGNYWVEFKGNNNLKNKNKNDNINNNNNNSNSNSERRQKQILENCLNTPLRWPAKLYSVTVPFEYETKNNELLRVHNTIFTRYWKQDDPSSSAVLRFQFQALLS